MVAKLANRAMALEEDGLKAMVCWTINRGCKL